MTGGIESLDPTVRVDDNDPIDGGYDSWNEYNEVDSPVVGDIPMTVQSCKNDNTRSAADIATGGDHSVWTAMQLAAQNAGADFIEDINGPCQWGCVHADWRNHGGGYQ